MLYLVRSTTEEGSNIGEYIGYWLVYTKEVKQDSRYCRSHHSCRIRLFNQLLH
ncbi:hypothetical protein ABKV19_003272 [Rosa sericea]